MGMHQPNWSNLQPIIFASAGIYSVESPRLTAIGRNEGVIGPHQHLLKIGRTVNFDLRRQTVRGTNDYNVHDARPYFSMSDWKEVLFRPCPEEEIYELEKEVHMELDAARLSMNESRRLHEELHGCPWPASTRPEIFKLTLVDPVFRRSLDPEPGPRRKEKHGEKYGRPAPGQF